MNYTIKLQFIWRFWLKDFTVPDVKQTQTGSRQKWFLSPFVWFFFSVGFSFCLPICRGTNCLRFTHDKFCEDSYLQPNPLLILTRYVVISFPLRRSHVEMLSSKEAGCILMHHSLPAAIHQSTAPALLPVFLTLHRTDHTLKCVLIKQNRGKGHFVSWTHALDMERW